MAYDHQIPQTYMRQWCYKKNSVYTKKRTTNILKFEIFKKFLEKAIFIP